MSNWANKAKISGQMLARQKRNQLAALLLLMHLQTSTYMLAASLKSSKPLIVTSYFYWYDANTKEHVLNGDGSDALTDHPPTLEGFSYRNKQWHMQQLKDMIAAGIDVLLPVYWGSPAMCPNVQFSDDGLGPLIAAREELLKTGARPPAIGMFYDNTTLGGANGKSLRIDLRTEEGRKWYYHTIARFFSQIPRKHWALVKGKPIIFNYTLSFASGVDPQLFPYVRKRFQQDFGCGLYIVSPAEEQSARALLLLPEITSLAKAGLGKYRYFQVIGWILSNNECFALSGNSLPAFIERLFIKILGRIPAASEKTYWLKRLESAPRSAVVLELLSSDEGLSTLVARWYQYYLQRSENLQQLKALPEVIKCAGVLKRGYDPLTVLALILSSREFYVVSGGTTYNFVEKLYRKVLLRPADYQGKEMWVNAFKTRPIASVLKEFLASDESVKVQLARWYIDFLERSSAGAVDANYQWGGAISPRLKAVPSIGPGFNNSAVPLSLRNGSAPTIVDRRGGEFYRKAWQQVLSMQPRPKMVHLETWNEFHEGSEIAETKEYGRKYLDITRHFANLFHAGAEKN